MKRFSIRSGTTPGKANRRDSGDVPKSKTACSAINQK